MNSSYLARKRLGLSQPSEFSLDGIPLMDFTTNTPFASNYPCTSSPFSSASTVSDYNWPNFDTSQANSPVQSYACDDTFRDRTRKAGVKYSWSDESWPLSDSGVYQDSQSNILQPRPQVSRQPAFIDQRSHLPASSFIQTSSQTNTQRLRTPRSLLDQDFSQHAVELIRSHSTASAAQEQAPEYPSKIVEVGCVDGPSLCDKSQVIPDNATVQVESPNRGEMSDDDCETSEPYAKLIWRALLSAPGHGMVLKDIYDWFTKHTDKGVEKTKGWQNSIRHNLSMNGVS